MSKKIMSFTIDEKIYNSWKKIKKQEDINLSSMVNKFLTRKLKQRERKE